MTRRSTPQITGMEPVERQEPKAAYEAPLYERELESELSQEIWEEFAGGSWCFGCTNCNCN